MELDRCPSVGRRRGWFWLLILNNTNVAGGDTLPELLVSLWRNARHVPRWTPYVRGNPVRRFAAAGVRWAAWVFCAIGVVLLWAAAEVEGK